MANYNFNRYDTGLRNPQCSWGNVNAPYCLSATTNNAVYPYYPSQYPENKPFYFFQSAYNGWVTGPIKLTYKNPNNPNAKLKFWGGSGLPQYQSTSSVSPITATETQNADGSWTYVFNWPSARTFLWISEDQLDSTRYYYKNPIPEGFIEDEYYSRWDKDWNSSLLVTYSNGQWSRNNNKNMHKRVSGTWKIS